MEGESSNSGERRTKRPRMRNRTRESISYETSVENLSREGKLTLRIMNERRPRPLNTLPNTSCAVFDNTCPDYGWLRSGWIVEERLKSHGRLYRYYYDPVGQMHITRSGVEHICAELEKRRVIILD